VEKEAMIRVLLVDDHQVVRQGLRQVLSEEPDMGFVGEAGNVSELLDQVKEYEWDVVVLDIGLPERSGLEGLREIKAIRPEMPVLILSMHSEGCYVERAFEEGASGYVTKESAAEEVVEGIRKVVSGGRFVSPSLADILAGDDGGKE
jgi:two-component system invasion response regulator UvrY